MMPEGGESTADQLKAEGNEHHKNKDYRLAIKSYTAAIEQSPDNFTLYGNRSASHINLGNYSDALEDANSATRINSNFVKGYLRQIKCHIALGHAALAQNVEQRMSQMGLQLSEEEKKMKLAYDKDIHALTSFDANARKASESGDYRQAAYFFEQCSILAPGCTAYKILKAESVAKLGRYTEASELASDVVRREKMNADAIYVLALCHYYQDNMEKALTLLGEVLRQAPDHSKSMKTYKLVKKLSKMKEEGNDAFKSGDFEKAYELYTQALELDPDNKITNAKLYCNRANAGSKLKKIEQSIKDCDRAIQLDENYEKAYLRRAKLLQQAERFDEALRDCEHIYKKNPTPANKQSVREAKLELKKSKRKDYYKLLGVDKSASDEEIKKAYKKLALLHHPDRHQTDEQSEKSEHERKFKEIGEAYAVLSDKVKRQKYDSGQDLEDFDGVGGFQDIDPSQIFQMFFSGGEGHPFNMGGGGSGGRRHHHHNFGGPGMHFSFQTG